MSSIIAQKTVLQLDLAAKDSRISDVAEAANNLASVMRNAHAWLWGLPTDRLLSMLNADVEATLATFAQNTALGLATNAALDAANILGDDGDPKFAQRAPVSCGRADISFDFEARLFVHIEEASSAPFVPPSEA